MKYNNRLHIKDKAHELILHDQYLEVNYDAKKENKKVPFNELKEVKLLYTPSYQGNEESYTCTLIDGQNQKTKICSQYFVKLATTRNQQDEYSAFIKELHQRLNPYKIMYSKGSGSALYVLMWVIFILGAVGFPTIAIGTFIKAKYSVSITMILVGALLLKVLWSFIKSYKRTSYDPNNLQEHLPQ